MTCRVCLHWDKCFKKHGTRYYGKDSACGNVEKLCEWYVQKAEQKWIPVTERLPEGCKEVLVTDGINTFMPFYCPWDGTFRDARAGRGIIVLNVTHWMPLPQPPKEGE